MNNFNLQTSHPLIQSAQTFVLDRKLVSIHSVDRDYKKWPNSNHFGIDLGEAFHNVQSLRLINFTVPLNNYTFSKSYQNTMMTFQYKTKLLIKIKNLLNNANIRTAIDDILNAIFIPNGDSSTWNTKKPSDIKIYGKVGNNFVEADYTGTASQDKSPWNDVNILDNNNLAQIRINWEPSDFQIKLPEGSYTSNQLANTLQYLMNQSVYNASADLSHNCFPTRSGVTLNGTSLITNFDQNTSAWQQIGIKPFIVKYNDVTNKLHIGSKEGEFTLKCSKQEIYDPECDVNKAIFHQYTKWGLPSYLGFNKTDYISSSTDISSNNNYTNNMGGLILSFENSPWLTPEGINNIELTSISNDNNYSNDTVQINYNSIVYDVSANHNLDIKGEDALYMEIDRYNSIDEIYPYSERTGHLYNNDLGHRVNGSFAKIPLTHTPFGQEVATRDNLNLNIFHSDPPIQRIDRFKFKFRYHDGRLVDFKNLPFSFTIEMNMLKDEQTRAKKVRVPSLYNL